MVARIQCLIILLLGLLWTSCSNDKLAKSDYKSLKGTEINFPNNMEKYKSENAEVSDKPYKLLIFRDSLCCTPCYIKSFDEWQGFLSAIKPDRMDLVFVLSPKRDEYINVKSVLHSHKYEWSVYIDKKNAFWKANPQIPEDKIYHCMLLDKQNKVVIIGNPMKNEKIAKMIIQKVNK